MGKFWDISYSILGNRLEIGILSGHFFLKHMSDIYGHYSKNSLNFRKMGLL
jgi:hypothetical protein